THRAVCRASSTLYTSCNLMLPRLRPLLLLLLALTWTLSSPAAGWAQSQAANGSIEGTVTDTTGATLPGATVTVTSADTGAQRSVVANENGVFRALLLPLGTYTLVAELQGFKKFEQAGI